MTQRTKEAERSELHKTIWRIDNLDFDSRLAEGDLAAIVADLEVEAL